MTTIIRRLYPKLTKKKEAAIIAAGLKMESTAPAARVTFRTIVRLLKAPSVFLLYSNKKLPHLKSLSRGLLLSLNSREA